MLESDLANYAMGVFTLLFFSAIAVFMGDFFHPRDRNFTTVCIVAGGIFVFLGVTAMLGAFLGFK